jgi:hypothetical protein
MFPWVNLMRTYGRRRNPGSVQIFFNMRKGCESNSPIKPEEGIVRADIFMFSPQSDLLRIRRISRLFCRRYHLQICPGSNAER